MHVVQKGIHPDEHLMTGSCDICGTMIECLRKEARTTIWFVIPTYRPYVTCPTCRSSIFVSKKGDIEEIQKKNKYYPPGTIVFEEDIYTDVNGKSCHIVAGRPYEIVKIDQRRQRYRILDLSEPCYKPTELSFGLVKWKGKILSHQGH